jgi:hypothetical protein
MGVEVIGVLAVGPTASREHASRLVIGVLAVDPTTSREHASRMGEETVTSLRQGVLRGKGRRN